MGHSQSLNLNPCGYHAACSHAIHRSEAKPACPASKARNGRRSWVSSKMIQVHLPRVNRSFMAKYVLDVVSLFFMFVSHEYILDILDFVYLVNFTIARSRAVAVYSKIIHKCMYITRTEVQWFYMLQNFLSLHVCETATSPATAQPGHRDVLSMHTTFFRRPQVMNCTVRTFCQHSESKRN